MNLPEFLTKQFWTVPDNRYGVFAVFILVAASGYFIWNVIERRSAVNAYGEGRLSEIGLQSAVDGVSLESRYREILTVFGTPEEGRRGSAMKYGGHIYHADYPSLGISFRFIASGHPYDHNSVVFDMVVTNSEVSVRGVKIGATYTDVKKLFGIPMWQDDMQRKFKDFDLELDYGTRSTAPHEQVVRRIRLANTDVVLIQS